MQELTDDQLDGLFRKSAEEFDPPFDPTAWQDMQARLDANGPTAPVGSSTVWKNLLRWGLPTLLLLLASVWYVNRDDKPRPGTSPIRSRAVQDQAMRSTGPAVSGTGALSTKVPNADAPTASAPGEAKQVSNEPSLATRESAPVTQVAEETKRAVTPTDVTANAPERLTRERQPNADGKLQNRDVATKAVVSAYGAVETGRGQLTSDAKSLRADRSVTATKELGSQPRNRAAFIAKGSTRRTRKDVGPPMAPDFSPTLYARNGRQSFTKRSVASGTVSSPTGGWEAKTEAGLGSGNSEERLLLPMISELPGRSVRWSEPTPGLTRVVTMPTDPVDNVIQPQPAAPRGLSVRLMVAPDLSAVGLRNFSRPGTNVGLLLEYRLGRRWSVQTGVIQSTKVYRALPGEYGNLPENLERYKANLAEVSGRCTMFDIPINVRYDVLVKPRKDGMQPTRGFISSGVTSYIMNREDYTYTYYHYYPSNTTSWSTSTGGYGFSNLNLSIGYERAFSRRLSWQVEPFMKVPVRRVGYFKIDLLSTGAFFSIRYKL